MRKINRILGALMGIMMVMMVLVPRTVYATTVTTDDIQSSGTKVRILDKLKVQGATYPYTTNTYDLGLTSRVWRTLYTQDVKFVPKSAASTTAEGYVYYDSDLDNLLLWANGEWVDLTAGAAGTNTLDASYDADSGERTITVDDGAVSFDLAGAHNFVVDMQSTGDVVLQDTGVAAFTFSDAGAATFAGVAEATAVLTLTAGDLVVTNGDLTLSSGEVSFTTDDTTTDGVTIVGDTLTTGQALAITYNATTHTSGNLFEIAATGVNVDFSVAEDGATVIDGSAEATAALTLTKGDVIVTDGDLTLSGGEVAVTTDDTTTDAFAITGSTLTTGQVLTMTYNATTHTSGTLFEIYDAVAAANDFTVSEDGATVITGSAEATAALTLTAGDVIVTNGDVTLSSGELSVTTDDTSTDAATIVGDTLTTGQALAITYDASNHTSGNIFEVADSDAGVDFAIAENGATTLTGASEGVSVLTLTAGDLTISDGDLIIADGELAATTEETTADGFTITGDTLTTGQVLALTYNATTHTSGNLIELSATGVGVDFSVAEDGATVIDGNADGTAALTLTKGDIVVTDGNLTLSGGDVAVTADATTTDAFAITGSTLTTGQALTMTYNSTTHTSGTIFEIYDAATTANDFTVSEDGATVITGNAEGTAALTLTKGDVIVTDGDLTLSGGEASVTSSATGSVALTVASLADSTVGPVDLAPDMVSGTIIDATVTGAPVLSGALLGVVVNLSNAAEDTNDQATTGVQITMDDNDGAVADTLAVDINGTGDYAIDMDGYTAGTAEFLLMNAETISNVTNDKIIFSDGTDSLTLDLSATANQVLFSLDGSIATTDGTADTLEIDPFATGAGFVVGGGAAEDYLGSTTLEWKGAYITDNTGINFGADQDVLVAYDEATDDRLEITGTTASVYIEDVLTLGKQAETINGANDSVDITASYLEITATAATDDLILATTGVTEGDILIVVNVAANAFQIDGGTATMMIDGGADFDVPQYNGLIFVFDGTNWLQLGKITTNS